MKEPYDPHRAAEVATWRMNIALAMIQMWRKGYQALLTWSIDFQQLRSYKDPNGLLADLDKKSMAEGLSDTIKYCEQVENDIDAAIRRKQFNRIK